MSSKFVKRPTSYKRQTANIKILLDKFVFIITVNDVYQIDQWGRYATCRRQEAAYGANLTIGTLPGDFVSPSLLSSMDKGFGMVDCMNLAAIDYVCLGNHEADIGLKQLHNRIRQSKFQWINSNMQTLPLPSDIPKMPEYVILEITTGDHKRRIALIGLMTEDKSLLRKGAFGDAIVEPLFEKACSLYDFIVENEKKNGGIDAIIPLTHQDMPKDRQMASLRPFPVILGGHDHEIYFEDIDGCKIIKTGADANKIAIVEVTWLNKTDTKPTVSIQLKDAKEYEPDPIVQAAIIENKSILAEIEKASLCAITVPKFNSKLMRLNPNNVGTFICTTIKQALRTECTILGSGCIRGNHDYQGEPQFTYAHLKAEIPFSTEVVVVSLPGKVICESISFSRAASLQSPPIEQGGFLQTDDGITWSGSNNQVLTIANAPVDMNRMYTVAIAHVLLEGMDNIAPLMEYKKNNSANNSQLNISADAGIPAKQIIVTYFSKILLFQMLNTVSFEQMDQNSDGLISKTELTTIAQMTLGNHVSKLVIDNLFSIADEDGSGFINRAEIMSLFGSAMERKVTDSNSTEVALNDIKESADNVQI
eukprot:gene5101-10203_t